MSQGTGKQISEAVYKMLLDWKLTDKIEGICFYITASNTRCKQGACTIIQQRLEKSFIMFSLSPSLA